MFRISIKHIVVSIIAFALFLCANLSYAIVNQYGECWALEYTFMGNCTNVGWSNPATFSWNPRFLWIDSGFPDPVYGACVSFSIRIWQKIDGVWEQRGGDGRGGNRVAWDALLMEINGTDTQVDFDQRETETCGAVDPLANQGPPDC